MKKRPTSQATSKSFISVTQAAQLLKVTRQNIHDAINRGRLKASRVGNVVLIAPSALEAYKKSRKRTGRPPKKD